MVDDYTLVPSLDRASLDDYVRFFQDAYPGEGKLTTQYLSWEYVENPHGRVIGVDAFRGDELAAHYAIIPRRYQLGAQLFEAALSVNTATHPKHQGKGLFARLAEATYAAAAQRGVQFVVGIANASSIGGFIRRLGFTELGQVRLYGCFKSPKRPHDALTLSIDAHWLKWRLANPSRHYVVIRHPDGSSTIRVHVKKVPFNIARIESDFTGRGLAGESLTAGSALSPGLAPVFARTAPPLPCLPARVQPSPWHVIWRSLSAACGPSMSTHLYFEGLAMDTF